jgi:protein phosphatase 2C family protein 2/3
LKKGFAAAEVAFLRMAKEGTLEKSGSTALVVRIVGDLCYVANVGDSRAVMSGFGGTKVYPLTKDHRPMDKNEMQRISAAGGKIYQTCT